MPSIEFYFDFISPYGYFASEAIEPLALKHGRAVDWRPMLLGVSVLKVMGLKPLLETPLKGAYVQRDVDRLARRLQLPLGRELGKPPSSSLLVARVCCWFRQHRPELVGELVHTLYRAIWREGRNLTELDELAQLALPASLCAADIRAAALAQESAELLRALVSRSLEAGVFGSPTVVVDGEPFWGFDRLGEMDAWLTRGGW